MKKICVLFVLVLLSGLLLPAASLADYNRKLRIGVWDDPTWHTPKFGDKLLNKCGKYCKRTSSTEVVCDFPEGNKTIKSCFGTPSN